jgi:hypothetical protein
LGRCARRTVLVMSAFMVTDKHIAYLVLALRRYSQRSAMTNHARDEIARILKAECARSVHYRYPAKDARCPHCGFEVCSPQVGWDPRDPLCTIAAPCPFAVVDVAQFDNGTLKIEPIATLKHARCYQYQACEHDEWEVSEARRLTNTLIEAAITALPGYEQAAWGL